MKPDGTPSVDDVLELYEQLQEFEKEQLLARIYRGGLKKYMVGLIFQYIVTDYD